MLDGAKWTEKNEQRERVIILNRTVVVDLHKKVLFDKRF
jgi:hypothetical protein